MYQSYNLSISRSITSSHVLLEIVRLFSYALHNAHAIAIILMDTLLCSIRYSMRQLLSETAHYIKLLVTEWVTWFLVVVGIITSFIPLLFPKVTIPNSFYTYYALIGFVIANFALWRKQHHTIIQLQPKPEPEPVSETRRSPLLLGHEYSLTLDSSDADRLESHNKESKHDISKAQQEISEYTAQGEHVNDNVLRAMKDKVDYYTNNAEYYRKDISGSKKGYTFPEIILKVNIIIKNIGTLDLEIVRLER